jgi:hypothetical protein
MRKIRSRIILKTFTWTSVALVVLLMIAPLALYQHAIGLIDQLPQKPTYLLSEREAAELWASKEKCKPEECASITPYWAYRWLLVAVVNDYVHPIGADSLYQNASKMAGVIAITHMRNGHFKGKRMLWWHITHACLGIWVQRNWTANEIATKYSQINAKQVLPVERDKVR